MNYRKAFAKATQGKDVREMSPAEIRAAERRARDVVVDVDTATDPDAARGGATLPPAAAPARPRRRH